MLKGVQIIYWSLDEDRWLLTGFMKHGKNLIEVSKDFSTRTKAMLVEVCSVNREGYGIQAKTLYVSILEDFCIGN